KDPKAFSDIFFCDLANQADAGRIHGHLLKPAVCAAGHHQYEFGRVGFFQTLGDGSGNFRRSEILVLDIDKALRRTDHVKVQGLDLADFGQVLIFCAGARDADVDVLKMNLEIVWPQSLTIFGYWFKLPGGRLKPSVDAELPKRACHFSSQHHRHIVPGRITFSVWQSAIGIIVVVVRCVPPCRGDINTPTNCELVIEHDNFLMMTATRRMGSIETEFDGFGKSPSP